MGDGAPSFVRSSDAWVLFESWQPTREDMDATDWILMLQQRP